MGNATVTTVVKAPRGDVYDVFADRESYGAIVPVLSTKLIKSGDDSRAGVGAVHRLHVGPLGINEQIVALEPSTKVVYQAISWIPVRSWIGTIEFEDHPDGTLVTYSLDVEGGLPLPTFVLKQMAAGMAHGLGLCAGLALSRRARAGVL